MVVPAPVVVFAFNRPDHLRRTLAALAANELAAESDLTVFCDGPRTEKEKKLTDAVREIAQTAVGFRSCSVVERKKNQGLAPGIISGVTEMLERHRRVLVLEDDLVTSPYFLRYMNDCLTLYADNPKVASIHGWCFPHDVADPPESFFLRGADCWGWGTWKRAWDIFEPDAGKLLRQLRRQDGENEFNLGGACNLTAMLQDADDGRISSWCIRWHASAFLADMYTLYPGRSLVQNIGMDNSGRHCGETAKYTVVTSTIPVVVSSLPVTENADMKKAISDFYRDATACTNPVVIQRIKALVKRILPKRVRRLINRIRFDE